MTNYELRKYYGCDCVEVDEIDIGIMEDIGLASKGEHTVRCIDWQAVKAVYAETRSPDQRPKMVRQPYFELVFRDVKTAELITAKVYAAGLVMVLRNINAQLDGAAMGKKSSAVWELLKSKDIRIWVDWSPKYGEQVMFYNPER